MEIYTIFGIIVGIIFIGFFSEIIFKKFNIPDVLILILVGIGIGKFFSLNALSFGPSAKLFTTFALVFILFQGAINIDIRMLVRSLSKTSTLTILSFVLTVCVVAGIAYFFGYNLLTSLLIGTILGGTSSAVVIPLVNNVEIRDKYGLVLTLESAISDVLCIVGTITILEIIREGQFVASGVFKNILSSFSLALVIGLIVGLVWMIMLYRYDILSRSYMVTIAVMIGIYAFVESPFVQASGAIAVLFFGLILGNSRTLSVLKNNSKEKNDNDGKKSDKSNNDIIIRNVLSPSAKSFYSEISFFVKTFFFVYLGLLMDFSNPIIFLYGAILTIGIYIVRPLAVKLSFNGEQIETKERAILEILIPKGLAAAVLAQLAVQSGLLGEKAVEFGGLILSVVFLSIIFTSILVFLSQKEIFKGFFFFLGKEDS